MELNDLIKQLELIQKRQDFMGLSQFCGYKKVYCNGAEVLDAYWNEEDRCIDIVTRQDQKPWFKRWFINIRLPRIRLEKDYDYE